LSFFSGGGLPIFGVVTVRYAENQFTFYQQHAEHTTVGRRYVMSDFVLSELPRRSWVVSSAA
jgi:hypothetical protein